MWLTGLQIKHFQKGYDSCRWSNSLNFLCQIAGVCSTACKRRMPGFGPSMTPCMIGGADCFCYIGHLVKAIVYVQFSSTRIHTRTCTHTSLELWGDDDYSSSNSHYLRHFSNARTKHCYPATAEPVVLVKQGCDYPIQMVMSQ